VVAAVGLGLDPALQLQDGGVLAQLQHGVDAAVVLAGQRLELVQVPGVDDQRLLADGVAAQPQGQAHVGVVQVVRRADADVLDPLALGAATQLLEVAVEALDLGEEARLEEVLVEHAHRVVRVGGGHQAVAGVADGLEVTRRHEAGGANEGEVVAHRCPPAGARCSRARRRLRPSVG
jgi:hypothetical protein